MKFRVLFLTFVFSSIYAISKVDAAQLILSNETINYSTDKNFSDNTSYGILADGVTATINTNSNIYIENNKDGVLLNNSANLEINGNGSNYLMSEDNNVFMSASSDSILNIQDINIELSSGKNIGMYAYNSKINILSSNEKTNTIKINNINLENIATGMAMQALGGNISITNMDIELNNNGFGGIIALNYGEILITGTESQKIEAHRNSISAIYLSDFSKVDIKDMLLNLSGNNKGLITGYKSSLVIETPNILLDNLEENIKLTSGASMSLSGSNNTKGNLIMNTSSENNISIINGDFDFPLASSFNIENMDVIVQNGNFIYVGSEGVVTLKNSDIYTSNTAFKVDSSATINLQNVVLSGTESFVNSKPYIDGDGNYTFGIGTLNALNSKISGNMFNDSFGQVLDVNFDGVDWRSVGRSNMSNLTLAGVNDLYMTIYFGNSTTQGDLITIEDSATNSGTNTLHITSAGGDGSSDDAIVINQENATTKLSDTDFTLANIVDSGFYEYDRLGMDENNNIVLKSNGVMTNTANTITQVPSMHINIIKTGMNELNKRIGDLRENSPYVKNGAWVRTYAKHLDVNEKIDAKMNLYGMEAGYDYQIYSTCENKAYIGGMAGYLYTDNIKIHQTDEYNGKGHAKTPSVGIYGTLLNNKGWFADATMRYFWSDMKTSNQTSSGEMISYKPNRNFITGSLEGGKRFEYEISRKEKYIIEPKAEFKYAHARSKSFTTSNNSNIHYGTTESKVLRVGSMFGYEKHLDNGAIIEPYLEISGIQEFAGKTKIEYQGGKTRSDVGGFSIEVGGGINAKLDDNWNIYSDLMYEKGSVVKAISTNIGMRYNW